MMGPMTPAQIREVIRQHLAANGEDPIRVLDQLAMEYTEKNGKGALEIIESLKRVLKGPRKVRKKKPVAKTR